jgi:uncharacterized membrane protein
MTNIRPDFVFSYWIFAWYLLYELKVTTFSPKFSLILGLIENIIMFILMIHFGSKINTLVLFIIINIFLKVIPLYTLRNETFNIKNLYFAICFFAIYIFWLHINHVTLQGSLKEVYESLIHNKNNTPFMQLFENISKKYKQWK